MDIFNNKIKSNQSFKGKNYNFDADSSPKAWEYYEYVYKDRIKFDKRDLKRSNSRLVLNRYEILGKNISNMLVLGGDCFFNFNDIKINLFKKLILEENEDTRKIILKLEECNKKHHTFLNMNLMPVTGGLNNSKQSVYFNNAGYAFAGVGGSGAKYDRGDTFIYLLSETFDYIKDKKNKSLSILEAGKYLSNSIFKWSLQTQNFECLFRFLNSFTDVYEYCEILYMIDKTEVDVLIKNGKQPISDVNDVERYIETAINYWEIKKKIFEEIYSNNQ